MQIKTFRAKTMQQALDQVRHDLGPEATVLHTRELNTGLWSRLLRGREYEIAASRDVPQTEWLPEYSVSRGEAGVAGVEVQFDSVAAEPAVPQALAPSIVDEAPETDLFSVYTQLIEAELDEEHASRLVERLRGDLAAGPLSPTEERQRLTEVLAEELPTSGPIRAEGQGCRVVALVGPTGVGKTTTIAKLAANFRLRENVRVGLVTVDTYRIAAVEQLRTYADIIELPMEVVASPREMREALHAMEDLDLVLMDTAGRSPKDDVRIQELKAMLAEARPDEVHLVLSATASPRGLRTTAERFASVGTTSLLMTKLDEATGLGQIAGVAQASGLPLSYLTDGQNVPDDIQVAESHALAERMLSGNA